MTREAGHDRATGIAPIRMPAVASLRLAGSRCRATPPRMIATIDPIGTKLADHRHDAHDEAQDAERLIAGADGAGRSLRCVEAGIVVIAVSLHVSLGVPAMGITPNPPRLASRDGRFGSARARPAHIVDDVARPGRGTRVGRTRGRARPTCRATAPAWASGSRSNGPSRRSTRRSRMHPATPTSAASRSAGICRFTGRGSKPRPLVGLLAASCGTTPYTVALETWRLAAEGHPPPPRQGRGSTTSPCVEQCATRSSPTTCCAAASPSM